MNSIYTILGTIGQWHTEGYDSNVPAEAIEALAEAYRICVDELMKNYIK